MCVCVCVCVCDNRIPPPSTPPSSNVFCMSQSSAANKWHTFPTALSSKCSDRGFHYRPQAEWFRGAFPESTRNPGQPLTIIPAWISRSPEISVRRIWSWIHADREILSICQMLEVPHFQWTGLSFHTLWATAKMRLTPAFVVEQSRLIGEEWKQPSNRLQKQKHVYCLENLSVHSLHERKSTLRNPFATQSWLNPPPPPCHQS